MTPALTLTDLTYRRLRDYLKDQSAAAYVPDAEWFPLFTPAAAKTPGRIVCLTVGGGPGLNETATYDRLTFSLRAVGLPDNYADAEAFALALDALVVTAPSTLVDVVLGDGPPGAAWRALYFTRTGGRPSLLMQDNGERYHFQASYITEATTGF